MNVTLLHTTSLAIAIKAIRKCYASEEKSDSFIALYGDWQYEQDQLVLGDKDQALIKRIIAAGHDSVLEHIQFTFDIDGVSRGLLQQFARHRIGVSPSVRSTRYTLGKIKQEAHPFTSHAGLLAVDKYLVKSGNDFVDYNSIVQLEEVRQGALAGIFNDDLKYMLPESFITSMIVTFNARSLRHFFKLRLDSRAHWEIRALALKLFHLIPTNHMVLFDTIVIKSEDV